jgi:hypothetical protein
MKEKLEALKRALGNNKGCYAITIIVMFLYCLILSLQGFDLCDEGWVLSSYQQIYSCPETCEYYFLYYLSALVGGLWNSLFGCGGYFSFRLLNIIVILTTYTFLYLILKDICKKKYLIGVGYMIILLARNFMVVFHHNDLTSMLAMAIAYFLYQSVKSDNESRISDVKPNYLFGSALLTGINIFSRIPNITLTGVIAIVLFINYFYSRDIKKLIKNIGISILGFFIGALLILAIMAVLGHLNIFASSIRLNLLSAASSSSSSHSISNLLVVYAGNYLSIAKSCVVYGIPFLACMLYINRFKKCSVILTVLYSIVVIYFTYKWIHSGIYTIYAIALLISCCSIYFYKAERNMIYLISIAAAIAFLLPIGSDYGIGNMGISAVIMFFPISVVLYSKLVSEKIHTEYGMKFMRLSAVMFVAIFSFAQLWLLLGRCYFDEGSRFDKHYLISESKLATTFTTKEKAEEMDVLLSQLKKYVKEDDYTIFFQNLAMLHYLTKTKPYMYNSWVWTYDSENFEQHLKRAEHEIKNLPVVVREKGILPGSDWLKQSDRWDREDSPNDMWYKPKNITIIKDFLSRHNYMVVWEDDYFQIYLPN